MEIQHLQSCQDTGFFSTGQELRQSVFQPSEVRALWLLLCFSWFRYLFFLKLFTLILEEHMALILISIVFLMLASEKGEQSQEQGSLSKYKYKAFALFLFLITGVLGLFAFSRESLMIPIISFGEPSALLPLLSGLFGASQLIISLFTSSKIPEESVSALKLSQKRIVRGILTGSAAGSLVAWLPGLSSAIAALLAGLFIKADFDKISLKKKDP